MIMSIYIVKIKNNFFGVYDSIKLALDFVYSIKNLINQNDQVLIQNYKINSNILLEELCVDLKYNITKKNNINYDTTTNLIATYDNTNIDEYEEDSSISTSVSSYSNNYISSEENSSEIDRKKDNLRRIIQEQHKLGQEKIELTQQINKVKELQKKLEEEELLYEADKKLYNKFKELKEKSTNFIVPELFINKYKVYEYLEKNNITSYDNFKKYYTPEKISTSYDNLFDDNKTTEEISNNDLEEINNVDTDELFIATNQTKTDIEYVITTSVSDSSTSSPN
jgi:hypothetical protein